MASYDSWEDADAAQNDELVQQVKDTSLDNNTPYHRGPPPGSTSFNPGVASFQPAAAYRPPNYASPQTNQFYGHAVNDPRAYAQRSNAQTYSNQPYRQQSHGTGDWHGGQPSNNAIYGPQSILIIRKPMTSRLLTFAQVRQISLATKPSAHNILSKPTQPSLVGH